MRRPRKPRGKGCNAGLLAVAAFFGALMCVSFFSVKVLLLAVAVLFIVLGLFLLKL